MKHLLLLSVLVLAACGGSKQADAPADSTSAPQDSIATVSIADPAPTDSVIAAPNPTPAAPESKTKTKVCKFTALEYGDCQHVIFDCGDFGNANVDALTPKQKEGWQSLMAFEEHGDFPVANPDKVGKTFEIKYEEIEGDICDGLASSHKGTIQKVLSFKQVAN